MSILLTWYSEPVLVLCSDYSALVAILKPNFKSVLFTEGKF